MFLNHLGPPAGAACAASRGGFAGRRAAASARSCRFRSRSSLLKPFWPLTLFAAAGFPYRVHPEPSYRSSTPCG